MTISRFALIIVLLLPSIGFCQEEGGNERIFSWRLFPAFASQPETGFQFGVSAAFTWLDADTTERRFNRPSTFTPVVLYTVRNQILSDFNIDYFFDSGTNLNASPRFSIFPDRFFGIGSNTDPNAFESYTRETFQLEGQLSIPKTEKLFWGFYFDIQQSSLREFEVGGTLENRTLLGSRGGFQAGAGPAVRFDSRDNTIYPSKGYFINATSLFTYLGDFAYANYVLDFRRYFSLQGNTDVLAFQVVGTFTSGDEIPFYKLPQLGGNFGLRGISNASVYMDRQLLFSQVEYRKHLFGPIGAVVFAGLGDVADRAADYNFSEFKYAGGLGLRFQIIDEEKLNLRFDYGFASENQSAFYVTLREAF